MNWSPHLFTLFFTTILLMVQWHAPASGATDTDTTRADTKVGKITPIISAAFLDSCTSEPVAFTNPNGTVVSLQVRGVPENRELEVEFEWRIAGAPDAEAVRTRSVLGPIPSTLDRDYRFSMPRQRQLARMLERTPESRILELKVEVRSEDWLFESSTEVVLSAPGFEYYLKDGPPLCRYFTKAAVRSGYYYNEDPAPMELKRKFIRTSESGAGRQYMPVFYSGMGIDRYFHSLLEIEREWELTTHQGGVFAERIDFTRFHAIRYQWDPVAKGACGAFVAVSRGVLDLGQSVTDFFTVPRSASGDPDRIESFLNSFLPQNPVCSGSAAPLILEFPAFHEFRYQPLAR